jgi:hypothetical protein
MITSKEAMALFLHAIIRAVCEALFLTSEGRSGPMQNVLSILSLTDASSVGDIISLSQYSKKWVWQSRSNIYFSFNLFKSCIDKY